MFLASFLFVFLLQPHDVGECGPPRDSDWPDRRVRVVVNLSESEVRRVIDALSGRWGLDGPDAGNIIEAIGASLPAGVGPPPPPARDAFGRYELRDRRTGTIWSGPRPGEVRAYVEMVEGGLVKVPFGPMRRPLPCVASMPGWKMWRDWRARRLYP